MSTEKPDEKLARFLRHNPIEDRVYLKEYVRDHPDQRMAWYLLGREYAARGDRGKAAYCYAQSGEIYEAFEKRKITVDWSALDSSVPWPQELKTAAKRSRRRKAALTAALLALIMLLPSPAGPDAGDGRPGGSGAASAELPAADGELRVYLAAEGSSAAEKSASGALGQMLLRDRRAGGEAVLLSAQGADGPGGGWIAWHRPLKPLLSVASGGPAEAAAIAYFDAAACNCRPDDPGRFAEPAGAWRQRQEQLLVLRSAMEAYRAAGGKLPERPEELLRPYPDNVMSGLTPYMREAFPLVREAAAAGGGAAGGAAGTAGTEAGPGTKPPATSAAAEAALSEPLAIVVDTKLHRLALVSGRTVVRSYEVGLGGARTPLGEFAVSEKVRNPKGRTKGEFGTRGMTLSDTDYAIHGTRHPSSIGKDESLGCIRMKQEDVEELFDMAPKGTKVTIGSGLLPAGLVGDGPGGAGAAKGSGTPGAGFGPKGAFKLPSEVKETNPGKVYRWLD